MDPRERNAREATSPLRVAIEVRSLAGGGLETVVAELVRGLPRQGIETVLVCTESGGALAERLRAEGHRVEILSGDDRRAEMAEILDRSRIDLVDTHYSTLGTPIAAERDVPVVVTLHNAYAWLGAAVYDEMRALDPQVSAYVAVSESVADFCSRRFHIDRDRIALVRNGARGPRPASDDERRAARAALGIAPDAELVLQVGAVSRVKSQLATVDAVAELATSRPRLVAWLVGGESEPDYADLVRSRIAERGLEERVVLAGARGDVATLLAAADVFALPSVIEGLSLAAIEAVQAGVPAVLTRTGDAAFLLGEAEAASASDRAAASAPLPGALIQGPQIDPFAIDWRSLREIAGAEHPAHAAPLAAALREVLDDLPARRAAARARGVALAQALHPDEMVRATAAVLHRVAARHAIARARRHERTAAELRAELARERADAAELRAELGRIAAQVDAGFDDARRRLAEIAAEATTASRVAAQGLEIGRRTLDKLRLKHRAAQALRGLRDRIAPAARGTARRRAASGAASDAPIRSLGDPHRLADTAVAGRDAGPREEHWLIVAVVPFDDIGGAQRSAQLARALVGSGRRVTYVARFPRQESVDLGLRAELPGLTCLDWDAAAMRAWLRGRDERLRVVVEAPDAEVVEWVGLARAHGARIVYDKIDAWEACDWATWFRPDLERELVDLSDDLVASASALERKLAEAGRPVHLLPNAVDRRLFDPAAVAGREPPPDLVRGERTLVYAGSLWGDWFDWQIVAGLAAARPSWRVNLIGDPPQAVPVELPDNVAFLGLKPQSALPAYYAAADACLIPFARGPVVDAVSPLKVYEYLAMHRPVVATSMPELREMPYVFVADDAAAAVAAVERAATTPAPVEAIEAFVARNTWRERTSRLAALCERPTIAVIVLCYDNADVIGRCVETLVRCRGDAGYRVVVVDNGSTDGSLDVLRAHERAGDIALVQNSRNGCSSGRNLGLAATASEIVVFLDSDQWALGEGWLDPALEILREHAGIGAVGWNAGWFDPGSGRGPIVDYLPERGMTGAHAGARYRTDVAYLATSGFVAPRAVLARTEGFDEFFDPTCFEDTDLSFQIKALGYELAYCPAIGVGHRPHQTTGSLDGYKGYLLRNERYFLEKWRDRPEFFFGVPAD